MLVPKGFINVILNYGTTVLIRINSINLIERKGYFTQIKLDEEVIVIDEEYNNFVTRLDKLLKEDSEKREE